MLKVRIVFLSTIKVVYIHLNLTVHVLFNWNFKLKCTLVHKCYLKCFFRKGKILWELHILVVCHLHLNHITTRVVQYNETVFINLRFKRHKTDVAHIQIYLQIWEIVWRLWVVSNVNRCLRWIKTYTEFQMPCISKGVPNMGFLLQCTRWPYLHTIDFACRRW